MGAGGRHPSVPRAARTGTASGASAELREAIESVSLKLLKKLDEAIEKKSDELNGLGIKELTRELRGLLGSLRGPATSLMQVNFPQTSQEPRSVSARTTRIARATVLPASRDALRVEQARFLEKQ